MRILLKIGLVVLLVSCAGLGLDNSAFKLETTKYDDTNSGVILFRTINTNTNNELSGFALAFKSENGGLYISNKSGLSGYPSETYYALRVPEGKYILDNFFVYGGQMKPLNEPFSFSIKSGDTIYIGTLIKPWTLSESQMPKNITAFSFKDYAKRSLTGAGVPAKLMVANEGEKVQESFMSKFPLLDGAKIETRLLQ